MDKFKLKKLNFPNYNFNFKINDNKPYIFDVVRKKFIVLTPEEWVRQNVVKYLIEKDVSLNHIGIEKQIIVNNLKKRFDVVVFDRNSNVLLLVECKSSDIKIDQKVFDQIAIYNKSVNSNYMMVTNGFEHYYFKIDSTKKNYKFLNKFPLI